MKKVFIFIIGYLIMLAGYGQNTENRTPATKADSGNSNSARADIKITIADSTKNAVNAASGNAVNNCSYCGKAVEGFDWVLVFSPILLFLIIILILNRKLKNFDLSDALNEPEMGRKIIPNDKYTNENLQALKDNPAMTSVLTPTIEVSDGKYAKSSSRYIALITSALAWVIGSCLCCYFIYLYILTGKSPELNKLTDLVLTLGIGVVPYVFNKISEAIKK